MRRREFITLVGGAAATWPLATGAQQPDKVWRIGILGPSHDTPATAAQYQAFLAEMKALGFNEGKNFTINYGRVDDPRGAFVAAAELMRSPIDLIWANGPEVALQAVVGASGFVPIVFLAVNYDPIQRGYVSSLAHPGGNITGIFYRQPELAAKQLAADASISECDPLGRHLGCALSRPVRRGKAGGGAAFLAAAAQAGEPALRFCRGVPNARARRRADGPRPV
jgi:ABC transporter substrate binding protein